MSGDDYTSILLALLAAAVAVAWLSRLPPEDP